MKWWLYIAFKQLFPTGKIMSFFAGVSVLGVALGVLGLYGTQSVMNGFHEQIGIKLRDTSGDVIIRNGGRAIRGGKEIVEKLKAMPGVDKVEECGKGPVMMLFENVPSFPMLRSYDTVSDECAIPIKEKGFVKMGDIDSLDDSSIILGMRFAGARGIGVGDFVEIYSPTLLDKIRADEVPMPVRLEVVGLLNTDFSDVDSNVALVSLRRFRELYNLGDMSHEIVVRLKNGDGASAFANFLNGDFLKGRMGAYTWLSSNENFLRVIKTEKVMMSLIILLIIIVASFSICVSLYTSVLRKTREIGLVAAMGGRGWQIAMTYCVQGFLIGVCGSALGLVLTRLILDFRDSIVDFILGRETLTEFYFFTRLPVKYDLYDAVSACVFATVLCTLAGLFPAWRASRLKASEAMRNE